MYAALFAFIAVYRSNSRICHAEKSKEGDDDRSLDEECIVAEVGVLTAVAFSSRSFSLMEGSVTVGIERARCFLSSSSIEGLKKQKF
jgi:hypothetical protein